VKGVAGNNGVGEQLIAVDNSPPASVDEASSDLPKNQWFLPMD